MAAEYILSDYGVTPDASELQTAKIQAVLDRCKNGGGTVIIPKGRYYTGSLLLGSDTTLLLETGAELVGSDERSDYAVYAIPEGVELRTDMEMITQYYQDRPWKEYRRAMISAYGERNIAIIGEEGSVIDGSDCYDPDGEEGFRGPHGIFLSNCENIALEGYTIRNSGNFMHQLDNCRNTRMRDVTSLAGHDGIHLHCCVNTLIEDCVFTTGDDCVAGINIDGLTIRRCRFNTSCDYFRIGGTHIHVEDSTFKGPGYYPHRMTVVRRKNDCLPREAGRHNTICLIVYFASTNFPAPEPSHDIVFSRCTIEGIDRLFCYHANTPPLEAGGHLTEVVFDKVTIRAIKGPSDIRADAAEPLTIRVYDSSVTMDAGDRPLTEIELRTSGIFDGGDPNTRVEIVR